MRVLVTGSRDWTDREIIRRALAEIADSYPHSWDDDGIVLVHGGCNLRRGGHPTTDPPRGADAIAHTLWRSWGLATEMHKAEWVTHGRAAGPIRNKFMVDLGADICLAFILDESPGATDCARRAREAGIPVHEYRLTSSEGTSDNAGGKAQRGPGRRREGAVRGNRGPREGRPQGSRAVVGAGGESLRDPA